jgi:leucyl aminopeptidase
MNITINKLIITFCTIFVTAFASTSNAESADYKIQYIKQVHQLFNEINPNSMWDQLTQLTSFRDRAAVHESGVQAAYWIKSQLEDWIIKSGRDDVTLVLIQPSGTYPGTDVRLIQPSIVVKIGDSNLPAVIIGAHIDTMATCGETISCDKLPDTFDKGPRPGADDDGTGVVTVMELTRSLLSSTLHFQKPIYLIFYAGEEAGYVGSKSIVKEFKDKNIPVSAVMQLDMTGLACKNDFTMWLHLDKYTNKNLTLYLQDLVNFYIKRPVNISTIGEGGSDDMMWGMSGFRTVRPQESINEFDKECGNLSMHSSNDTMDKLSLVHMSDYLKLATAFTVEMAEPISSNTISKSRK